MKKILSLLAAGAIALAASGQQNLTPEVLSSLKQSYAGNSADRARQSVVSNGSFRKLAMRPVVNTTGVNTHFSVDIRNTGITDQQSSGRCWMFTGLNVLRNKAMKKMGVSGFQFSHIYLFFYDQLEKSNLFLQGIIDTRNESIDHQKVQWLMQNPLSDGGTYTGVADLVSKYGLVPAEVQAETWASNNTSEIDGHLKRKLREIAINLREQAEAGKTEAELQAYKVEQLKTIYQMLVLAYGEPVQEFLWAPRGKDGKLLS
ncbi:MAG: C1 family peptidase, partial [Bacteroidaceae bacterium]|nr:C1 family peptidase [Bacteroidaceae bacterium]